MGVFADAARQGVIEMFLGLQMAVHFPSVQLVYPDTPLPLNSDSDLEDAPEEPALPDASKVLCLYITTQGPGCNMLLLACCATEPDTHSSSKCIAIVMLRHAAAVASCFNVEAACHAVLGMVLAL